MDKAFGSASKLIEEFRRTCSGVRADTLVGTGLSGALVVPLLARATRRRFLIVRKENDGSHAQTPAEGRLGKRWLFVDDFVSTGKTRIRVQRAVDETARYERFHTEYVGTYSYERMKLTLASTETRCYNFKDHDGRIRPCYPYGRS